MLYTAPNAVVDRVEVEAVGWPAVRRRRDERGVSRRRNSTVARTRRMEKTFLGLCPNKGQQFEHLW